MYITILSWGRGFYKFRGKHSRVRKHSKVRNIQKEKGKTFKGGWEKNGK